MTTQTYGCLVEALRRFECFAMRDGKKWTLADLQKAWTGLGFRTDYKAAVKEGYMRESSGTGFCHPRCMGWWSLTEKGAKVVLAWHRAGHGCKGGWEVTTTPPMPKR